MFSFLFLCSTDKTRWMESIQRPHNEGEEEKIYEHWGEGWGKGEWLCT